MLVKSPEAVEEFKPDAIVLSGTLRDFDYYKPEILDTFRELHHNSRVCRCWPSAAGINLSGLVSAPAS